MTVSYKTSFLTDSDIEKISLCEHAHFSDACSCATLRALIESGAVVAAAFCGEDVCGFGYISVAPGEGELLRIAVNSEYRGKGIAKKLLSLLHGGAREAGCEAIFLEVRESNLAAISLYESAGYTRIGTRKGFYKSPREDALLYKKEL